MKRLATAITGAAIASLIGPTAGSGYMRSFDLRGNLAGVALRAVELEPFRLELLLGADGGFVSGGAKSKTTKRLFEAEDELALIASDHLKSRFCENVYGDCLGVELDIVYDGVEVRDGVVSYGISGRALFAVETTPPPKSLSNQVTESFSSRDGAADFVRRLRLSNSDELARVQDVAAPIALLYPDGDSRETARRERRCHEIGFEDISMTLKQKKKADRVILDSVRGIAKPGE